ncbi:MAG: pyridoxal 5'-phosphate synthase glutaminase subunit PdxT, partial [Candidatus Poseidoniaceae archaeon]
IERNAFGRQKDSFQSEIRVSVGDNENFQGVFIRAPRFFKGSDHPIAWLSDEVVGVLEGRIMALTFHPELTEDYRFHEWLLSEANHTN